MPRRKKLTILKDWVKQCRGLELGLPPGMADHKDAIFDLVDPKGCRTVVEIGSLQGWFAYRCMRQLPKAIIYSIDTWSDGAREYGSGSYNYECWKKNLAEWDGLRAFALRGESHEVRKTFEEFCTTGIDLLFIDGDHTFKGVLTDLQDWEPLVNPGGVVAGHDWDSNAWPDVQEAVRHYRPDREINVGMIYHYTNPKNSALCYWWKK